MKLLLVISVLLPSVLGRCCMPEKFYAKSYSETGKQSHLGDIGIYVDFPSKKLTLDTGKETGLNGIEVDFGKGILYRDLGYMCTKDLYTGLSGFERCIPDSAKGNDTEEYWRYKLNNGMKVYIVLDPSDNCLPIYLSLSDTSIFRWQDAIVWAGLLKNHELNASPPYVNTFGCEDRTDDTVIG